MVAELLLRHQPLNSLALAHEQVLAHRVHGHEQPGARKRGGRAAECPEHVAVVQYVGAHRHVEQAHAQAERHQQRQQCQAHVAPAVPLVVAVARPRGRLLAQHRVQAEGQCAVLLADALAQRGHQAGPQLVTAGVLPGAETDEEELDVLAPQMQLGDDGLQEHQLAGRGLNIVLISRDLSKLEHEAKAIERLHGKSTRVIQVDFTGGLEIYEAIAAGLKDLEIGVLSTSLCLLGRALPSTPPPCSPWPGTLCGRPPFCPYPVSLGPLE
uniref:Uncharacterized protein n=1 Tax=Phocoena sinus TaxID=42100 RepID=A0A8C9BQS4_PHOSS